MRGDQPKTRIFLNNLINWPMHLHQGYVSISDVVEAIAKCIAPPPNYKLLMQQLNDADGRPIDVSDGSVIGREMAEWLERHKMRGLLDTLSRSFQYSEAAATLDQHLQNAREAGPRWFDVSVTGRPRRSDDAHREATSILLHMAKSWARYERAFHEGRLDGWPSCDFSQIEGFYGSNEAYKRVDEIMFDRDEIVSFLAKFDIKNSGLGGVPRDVNECAALSDGVSEGRNDGQGPWLSNPSSLTKKLAMTSKREGKAGLSTSEMAAAFGDNDSDRYRTHRDRDGWLQYLQRSLPAWLAEEHIRIQPGGPGRGRSAEWDPFEFAKAYVSKDFKGRSRAFNERFRSVEHLEPWRQAWTLWVAEQTDGM